jgi:DNA-binding protein YbaB
MQVQYRQDAARLIPKQYHLITELQEEYLQLQVLIPEEAELLLVTVQAPEDLIQVQIQQEVHILLQEEVLMDLLQQEPDTVRKTGIIKIEVHIRIPEDR